MVPLRYFPSGLDHRCPPHVSPHTLLFSYHSHPPLSLFLSSYSYQWPTRQQDFPCDGNRLWPNCIVTAAHFSKISDCSLCLCISNLNWNTGQSTTQWERKAQVQKQWNVLETFALYVKLGIPRDLQGEWETRRQTVEAFETVHTHNGLTLWEQLLFQLLCDGKKHPAVSIVCVLLDCKQARTFGVCV